MYHDLSFMAMDAEGCIQLTWTSQGNHDDIFFTIQLYCYMQSGDVYSKICKQSSIQEVNKTENGVSSHNITRSRV